MTREQALKESMRPCFCTDRTRIKMDCPCCTLEIISRLDVEPCECGHERGDHDGECRELASSGFRCSCPSFKDTK